MTILEHSSNAYDAQVSAVYDLFYGGRGQDFAADAVELLAAVREDREEHDPVRSLLDVGCGTGEHLRTLQFHVERADGLELSAAMRAVAAAKIDGTVHEGDLRDFELPLRYDVVCCLTSTVGYCRDTVELDAAVVGMARHLRPGGVLVIDPYWTPECFLDGHVAEDVVADGAVEVARRTESRRSGRAVRHRATYRLSGPEGVSEFGHEQHLTLFTTEEYLTALEGAGLRARARASRGGFAARGLYLGRAST